MTLIEKINAEFIAAYKAQPIIDTEKKNLLGVLKGELTKTTKNPTDQEVISKCKSMLKNNTESMKSMEEKGMEAISSLTDREIEILSSYLPVQMSEAEIDAKIKELVDAGANNIGRFMGGFKGLDADMSLVKKKAEEVLSTINA